MDENVNGTGGTVTGTPTKDTGHRIKNTVCRTLILLLVTVVLLIVTLFAMLFLMAKGPSKTVSRLFVMSVRETSAIGFLADIFFTDEQIAEIEALPTADESAETDASVIPVDKETQVAEGSCDQWGLIDDDGDGIIIDHIKGAGYTGVMMVVLDSSRVILGSVPETYGTRGYTIKEMVERFDGVAGINAGGFEDLNGQGNGSTPDSLVVYDGTMYYGDRGIQFGFAGIDGEGILHADCYDADDIIDAGIVYGASFGPRLIINGKAVDPDTLLSGINPRTAIGQRSDGAMLLLVIDGRQVNSLGATFEDLEDIMLSYGAVNAVNMDGGFSSLMWYNGEYINNSASVVGIRAVPTAFIVLKQRGNGTE